MTASNTFSGSPLDRAGARRADASWVAGLLHDPSSRTVAVTGDGVFVEDGDEARLARLPLAVVGDDGERFLLGIEPGGGALFAVDASELAPPPGVRAVGLRDAGALLSHGEGGVIAQATGLVNWHRRHPHCAVCGAATEVAEAGYV